MLIRSMNRTEIVDYIVRTLPEKAELPEVIHSLCKVRLEELPPHEREKVDEMREEAPLEELLHGRRLPATPTRNEVTQLLAAARCPRDMLMFRLLYSTGMRIGELTALLWADVRLDDQTVFVRSGKEDKDRYVLVDPETCRLLAEFGAGHGPEERVFDLSASRVRELFEQCGSDTGLLQRYQAMGRHLTPHSLRHAFATHMYENHMGELALKHLLGHESLDTTDIYLETGVHTWHEGYLSCHPLAFGSGGSKSTTDSVCPASETVSPRFKLWNEA